MIQNEKLSWFRIVDFCVCVCVCVCVFLVWGIQRGKNGLELLLRELEEECD